MGDKIMCKRGTCKRTRKAEKNTIGKKYCEALDKQVKGKSSRE